MSNRIYILIALAILIASPIIVTVVSNALPPPSNMSEAPANVSAQDEVDDPQPEDEAEAPPPPQGEVGSTEPVFDVQPSMDTSGIAPAPLAGEAGSESRRPADVSEPEPIPAPDQNSPPPPPPKPEIPASMNR